MDPEKFECVYRELIEKPVATKWSDLNVAVFLEADESDPMRVQMDLYGQITRTLAGDYDTVFVDVQAADRYLRSNRRSR